MFVDFSAGLLTPATLSNMMGLYLRKFFAYKLLKTFSIIFLLAFLSLNNHAMAQSLNLEIGEGGAVTGRLVQIIALMTVLSLAPSIMIMLTSFTRLVIVLSLLRTALGTQGTPPNTVLVSLAMFMTLFIMQPTLEQAYTNGIEPLIEERISESEAFEQSIAPFHDFMRRHVRQNELQLFMDIGKFDAVENPKDIPLLALVPAFMISELKRAFEIGFLVFVPFLIIDMVVASVLMSMGMMMLPPIMISLPFKLIFFVLVDGWYLIVGSLVKSFIP